MAMLIISLRGFIDILKKNFPFFLLKETKQKMYMGKVTGINTNKNSQPGKQQITRCKIKYMKRQTLLVTMNTTVNKIYNVLQVCMQIRQKLYISESVHPSHKTVLTPVSQMSNHFRKSILNAVT